MPSGGSMGPAYVFLHLFRKKNHKNANNSATIDVGEKMSKILESLEFFEEKSDIDA
jgi:hypothetical protein